MKHPKLLIGLSALGGLAAGIAISFAGVYYSYASGHLALVSTVRFEAQDSNYSRWYGHYHCDLIRMRTRGREVLAVRGKNMSDTIEGGYVAVRVSHSSDALAMWQERRAPLHISDPAPQYSAALNCVKEADRLGLN